MSKSQFFEPFVGKRYAEGINGKRILVGKIYIRILKIEKKAVSLQQKSEGTAFLMYPI